MNDMTETWIDTISEILSMLTYGWSAHELYISVEWDVKRYSSEQ